MEKAITEFDNDYDHEIDKPVILIIDDNEEILEFLANDLGRYFHVITIENADDGLTILENQVVSLIISDIMMEGIDGFEFCRIVKSSFEFGHIPVILLTAKNTLNSKIEGLEIGADAYIEKPFSPQVLQAQISSLLTNRAKIKQYFATSPTAPIQSIAHNTQNESFLEKLNDLIIKNLHNNEFSVEDLAYMMNVSRPTLYRRIKSISDMSPNELINLARLKMAAKLLLNSELKLYEISDMVGYTSQSYFGKSFFKQFGILPSEYANLKK